MTTLPALLSLLLTAAPVCTGQLEGSVEGSFDCSVVVERRADGREFLTIAATGPVANVPSCVPGSFEVTGLLHKGTYGLDRLGPGKASVAAENGTLYTATKTTGQRGEVTLTLERVEKGAPGSTAPRLQGSYRARLVPAGSGKTGEVRITVTFRS